MTQHRFIHMRSGAAKYSDLACLLGHPGPTDGFEPPTFVMIFDEAAPPREVWGGEDLDHVLIDVVAHRAPGWDRPQFVALSEEGAVVRMLLPGAMWSRTSPVRARGSPAPASTAIARRSARSTRGSM